MTMTYEQFCADCVKRQRAYCASELERMEKAHKLWREYSVAMEAIGLHALDVNKIVDRQYVVRRMSEAAEDTHGPTNPDMPCMYAAYVQQAGSA